MPSSEMCVCGRPKGHGQIIKDIDAHKFTTSAERERLLQREQTPIGKDITSRGQKGS